MGTVSHQLPQQQWAICHTEVASVQVIASWDMQSKSKSRISLEESHEMHTAFISASVCKGVVAKVLLAYHEIMAVAQRYTRHYADVQHI